MASAPRSIQPPGCRALNTPSDTPTTIASSIAVPASSQRLRKSLGDVARDRTPGDERSSEIAAQHAARIVRELSRQRLVEVELAAQARDRRGVGALAHHLEHRIARRHVQQQKSDDHDARERRDREERAASEQRSHAQCAVT